MPERLLNAQEVSTLAGCSVQTLNTWYKWAKLNPEHELAKLLPPFTRGAKINGKTRYWKMDAVYKLIEFKNQIPKGRGGILGEVTNMYRKPKKEKRDA